MILDLNELKKIETRREFADYIKIPLSTLTYILYKNLGNSYKIFKIKKKNGGERIITAPNSKLKKIQESIYLMLKKVQSDSFESKYIHSFIAKKKDITKNHITNAKTHLRKKIVINIDLENFFGMINRGRVIGFFEKNNHFELKKDIATILAQIICYKNQLPQGAPTSPVVSNMISQILDSRILKILKKYRLTYSRYADDLTFSTNDLKFIDKKDEFFYDVNGIIEKSGYKINHKKTRIQYFYKRQEVTGLTVNKKVGVSKEYCAKTRSMVHTLLKKGYYMNDEKEGTLKQLEGRLAYIDQIDKFNNKLLCKRKNAPRNTREKVYADFLFYKNFIADEKPIIITEGITDILYLKAALMKLSDEYPDLIKKNVDGTYDYKIKFLKRGEKISYLFNASPTGGDAFNALERLFKNKYDEFKEKKYSNINKCLIFVFDNEINTEGKPLHKYLKNKDKNKNKIKESLLKQSFAKVLVEPKTYVVTNQLMNNSDESEIEDLFDKETLSIQIENKSFSREKNIDVKKNYGKAIFAKHIYDNYQSIDFENFKYILNNIRNILKNQVI